MRISSISNDPDYYPHKFDVFINDEQISNCFTADEGLRIAHCYIIGKNGRVEETSRGTLKSKMLYGKVRIEKVA